MKTSWVRSLVCALVLVGSAASAWAAPLYLVEPMRCKGAIVGDASGVHPSYHQIAIQFLSFLSTRSDGGLAASLQVENKYFPPNVPADFDFDHGSIERWFMRPLRIDGKRVYLHNMSGRDDNLELKIVKSIVENGSREDLLEGTLSRPDTVAGPMAYRLRCIANVVKRPSRVDDYTR